MGPRPRSANGRTGRAAAALVAPHPGVPLPLWEGMVCMLLACRHPLLPGMYPCLAGCWAGGLVQGWGWQAAAAAAARGLQGSMTAQQPRTTVATTLLGACMRLGCRTTTAQLVVMVAGATREQHHMRDRGLVTAAAVQQTAATQPTVSLLMKTMTVRLAVTASSLMDTVSLPAAATATQVNSLATTAASLMGTSSLQATQENSLATTAASRAVTTASLTATVAILVGITTPKLLCMKARLAATAASTAVSSTAILLHLLLYLQLSRLQGRLSAHLMGFTRQGGGVQQLGQQQQEGQQGVPCLSR